MDISVVIPTADRGKLLARALLSVASQTHQPSEVLVVDNGKSDAEPFDNKILNLKTIKTAPMIGPSAARNIGWKAATGKLVAFLDDDDFWFDDYLELCLSRACQVSRSGNHDLPIVVSQLQRLDNNGIPKPYKLFPTNKKDQRKVYFSNPGFGGQNIVIPKYILEALNGFDETMPASVDRDFAARALQNNFEIVVANTAVSVLCDHPGDRVRANQVLGNKRFIQKHWHKMSPAELFKAINIYLSRKKRNR